MKEWPSYDATKDEGNLTNLVHRQTNVVGEKETYFPHVNGDDGQEVYHELIEQYVSQEAKGDLRDLILDLVSAGANQSKTLRDKIFAENFDSVRIVASAMQNVDELLVTAKPMPLHSTKLELYAEVCTRLFPSTTAEKKQQVAGDFFTEIF